MASLGCREDGEFAELLLAQGGVAVVPGSGFGAPRPYPAVVRLQHADPRTGVGADAPGDYRRATCRAGPAGRHGLRNQPWTQYERVA